jgi:hypothetical protein
MTDDERLRGLEEHLERVVEAYEHPAEDRESIAADAEYAVSDVEKLLMVEGRGEADDLARKRLMISRELARVRGDLTLVRRGAQGHALSTARRALERLRETRRGVYRLSQGT